MRSGLGLFVPWRSENDAEERMVGEEHQTLHESQVPGLGQSSAFGFA